LSLCQRRAQPTGRQYQTGLIGPEDSTIGAYPLMPGPQRRH
jgi:hypothetical protein